MKEAAPSLGSSQAVGADSLVWGGKQLRDPLSEGNPKYMQNESSLDCLELGKWSLVVMMGNKRGDAVGAVACPDSKEEPRSGLSWIIVILASLLDEMGLDVLL